MKKETLEFILRVEGAAVIGMIGGVAGASISHLLTDSHEIITAASTIADFVAESASYAFMQYHQCKSDYIIEGKFSAKKYFIDIGKMVFGFRLLDILNYAAIRPAINYSLQEYANFGPITSSVLADGFHMLYHAVTAYPVGKYLGLIRNMPDKANNIELSKDAKNPS